MHIVSSIRLNFTHVVEEITGAWGSSFGQSLEPSVEGVRQALTFAMSELDWTLYTPRAGARRKEH